jgi:acyl carrier protein
LATALRRVLLLWPAFLAAIALGGGCGGEQGPTDSGESGAATRAPATPPKSLKPVTFEKASNDATVAPRPRGTNVTVEKRVIEIVSEQMGVSTDRVNRNTSLVKDLGADELDIVELVMEFEEEFDITIPDEQAEKIQTVGQAIDFIEQHARAK